MRPRDASEMLIKQIQQQGFRIMHMRQYIDTVYDGDREGRDQAHGVTDNNRNIVAINFDDPESKVLDTLAHELGHIMAGHKYARHSLTEADREIEAQYASHYVFEALGAHNPYTESYLHGEKKPVRRVGNMISYNCGWLNDDGGHRQSHAESRNNGRLVADRIVANMREERRAA